MAFLDEMSYKIAVVPSGVDKTVWLSQNENGRELYFEITDTEIPADSTVTISGTKPDGVVYSAVGTLDGNTARFEEDTQLTAVAGEWIAKIRVTNGGNTVATARIRFVIDADPVKEGSVPSDSELEGLVAEAQQYAETARTEAYGSPLTANTAAEMTQKDRVYVYTGNESGYTAGSWYYWNGSAWTLGGVYNSQAIQTDTGLTIAGMAADAKATGEAITAAEEGAVAEALASVAPEYSNTATYAVGDYVVHNGQLYQCVTAIETGEEWTAAKWQAAKIAPDVTSLKSDLIKSNYATLSDAYSTTMQRITTSGVPTASSSWTTYWFKNVGYSNILCTVASLGTGDNAVSFYNNEIASSDTYIGGEPILNDTNIYIVNVPNDCKLIAISNRTASFESPTANLSLNLAQAGYQKVEELNIEVEAVKNSIPDTRYVTNETNCDFTKTCYITALTGVPHNSNSWKSYFFKNKGFTSVDCTVFLGSGDAAIAFYNDETVSADTFISAVVSTVNNGTRSYTSTVPDGCKLIAVCNKYSSLANPMVKLYMSMNSVYDKVFELEDEVDALSGKTDIFSANEDIAYIVSSSSAKTGVDYNKIRHKYFSVLHGSDFHKDATNFQRLMEYAYKNPSNVDCIFATGDFKDHWAETDDGFLMTYGAYYQSAGVPVLPIIGNHETGYSPAIESVSGSVNTIANIDAKFITPYMTYNGCVQGSGGYYYRDFVDYNVRVIALNEYEMPRIVNPNDNTKYLYNYWYRYLSQTQITWLCSTLGSVPDGYHVIFIMHMMPDKITEYTDNKFNSPNVIASDVYASAQGSIIQDIVDAYISKTTLSQTYANTIGAPSTDVPDVTVNVDFTSANGEFIAYIVGHTHYDKVGKSSIAANTQTVVVVTTSGTTKAYYDDLWREIGTKSQDCFNYIVFDTDSKRIRIIRVGANSTLNMDLRDMTSISYI